MLPEVAPSLLTPEVAPSLPETSFVSATNAEKDAYGVLFYVTGHSTVCVFMNVTGNMILRASCR